MEGGDACPKCGIQLVREGLHCWSCMAGGDATLEHNSVRDIFVDYSKRAGLRPEAEAPGLLRGSRERPADVLVVPQLALATVLPDGSRRVATERVCFDFAVINALGSSHWAETASGSGGAAEAYDCQKRRRNDTAARCRDQGLTFCPVVFEQQGGRSKAADSAIRSIAEAIGAREGVEASTVRRSFEQRLAVTLARCGADMIARRQRQVERKRACLSAAVATTFALHDDEESAEGHAEAFTFQCSLGGIGPAVPRDIRLG